MTPTIDVVIPASNGWELTASCLQHLRAQTVAHTVTVVDNGSVDGTPARLREIFPEARVVELGENLGFPAACNRGVAAGDRDVVVLLNNDVECRPEFLERLVEPFSDKRIGSVAVLLLKADEELIDSFGLTVDPTLAGYPRLHGSPAHAAQIVDPALVGPSGAAAAYRRRAWHAAGGLDEGVLFYGEDVDLALRLRAGGWLTAGVKEAVGIHLGSASIGPRSPRQRYQGGFARGYFLRRYGVLRHRAAVRAVATEAIVVAGDALVFSHDLAAVRGRVAGWRAGGRRPRRNWPPREAIDDRITFLESLRLRVDVYNG